MSKKKLISIVLSVILTVLAAVLGCAFGIDVDFSGIDVNDDTSEVLVYECRQDVP